MFPVLNLCRPSSPAPGPAEPHVGGPAVRGACGHCGGPAAVCPCSPPRKRHSVWVRIRSVLNTETGKSVGIKCVCVTVCTSVRRSAFKAPGPESLVSFTAARSFSRTCSEPQDSTCEYMLALLPRRPRVLTETQRFSRCCESLQTNMEVDSV